MFPTIVPYEQGLRDSGEPTFPNAHAYLLWIRDTYIRDTPFRYRDVQEIHEELQDLRPGRYYYQWQSLQKIMRWWRQRGIIKVLDQRDAHPRDHTLMWTAYYKRRMEDVERGSSSRPSKVREELAKAYKRIEEKYFGETED